MSKRGQSSILWQALSAAAVSFQPQPHTHTAKPTKPWSIPPSTDINCQHQQFFKTSQESRMLSSVTLNCQVTEIFISSDCQNCTYILKVTVPRVKPVFLIFCQILSGLVWSCLVWSLLVWSTTTSYPILHLLQEHCWAVLTIIIWRCLSRSDRVRCWPGTITNLVTNMWANITSNMIMQHQ